MFYMFGRTPEAGFLLRIFFPKTQPFEPMFIGFYRVAKGAAFCGFFTAQGLYYKGLT